MHLQTHLNTPHSFKVYFANVKYLLTFWGNAWLKVWNVTFVLSVKLELTWWKITTKKQQQNTLDFRNGLIPVNGVLVTQDLLAYFSKKHEVIKLGHWNICACVSVNTPKISTGTWSSRRILYTHYTSDRPVERLSTSPRVSHPPTGIQYTTCTHTYRHLHKSKSVRVHPAHIYNAKEHKRYENVRKIHKEKNYI